MMNAAILFCVAFVSEIAAQTSWISYMKQKHVSQVQKEYGTRIDAEIKEKVPSMGGMVFMLIGSGLLISAIIQGDSSAALFWSYPLLAGAVGLADDMLKYLRHSSEGLTSLRKFFFQAATTCAWFAALALGGFTPPLAGTFFAGAWTWAVALFFAIGVQNAVNVTDGLDGLAAGGSALSFGVLMFLSGRSDVSLQGAAVGLALSLGFLWHNSPPATVFMGDVGAHFLAGLMASCAFWGNGVLSLIPAASGFGIEMLSVVIQLIAIHGFKRKVFRMSPLHHHFQLIGWKEDKIVVRFWIVHLLMSSALLSVYLAF